MLAFTADAGKGNLRYQRQRFVLLAGLVGLIVIAFSAFPAAGQSPSESVAGDTNEAQPPQDEGPPAKPQVEKLGDGRYRIGTVEVDQNKREVYLPGQINMDEGLVELFACGPRGKLHESVLKLDVVPYHLQVALLLLGLSPGKGVEFQGDTSIPTGDLVEVWVEWDQPDSPASSPKVERHRAEELIFNLKTEKTMERTDWVFVGSKIVDGRFMAQVEQSLITTFHDPYTILDNPLSTGGDDTLYIVNKEVVPVRETPVRMTLKAVQRSKDK